MSNELREIVWTIWVCVMFAMLGYSYGRDAGWKACDNLHKELDRKFGKNKDKA